MTIPVRGANWRRRHQYTHARTHTHTICPLTVSAPQATVCSARVSPQQEELNERGRRGREGGRRGRGRGESVY